MTTFIKNYQIEPNQAQKATLSRMFKATTVQALSEGKTVVCNTWIANDKFTSDLVVNGVTMQQIQIGVRGGLLRTPKNEK